MIGTTERDYSGLHIRMLYAKELAAVPPDPYDIEGIDRNLRKQAVLVMIDAESEIRALREFTRQVCDSMNQELCFQGFMSAMSS